VLIACFAVLSIRDLLVIRIVHQKKALVVLDPEADEHKHQRMHSIVTYATFQWLGWLTWKPPMDEDVTAVATATF
jgi:hypothetical protein